jgi:hypothetical protein
MKKLQHIEKIFSLQPVEVVWRKEQTGSWSTALFQLSEKSRRTIRRNHRLSRRPGVESHR